MSAIIWNLVAFAVGLLTGMWVQKHPTETRAYGEGLAVRAKMALHWIGSKFKKTEAPGSTAGSEEHL